MYSGVIVLLEVTVSTTVFCQGRVWVEVTVEHAVTASTVEFVGAAEEGKAAAKATPAQSATVVRIEAIVVELECAGGRVDGLEVVVKSKLHAAKHAHVPSVRLHLLLGSHSVDKSQPPSGKGRMFFLFSNCHSQNQLLRLHTFHENYGVLGS